MVRGVKRYDRVDAGRVDGGFWYLEYLLSLEKVIWRGGKGVERYDRGGACRVDGGFWDIYFLWRK